MWIDNLKKNQFNTIMNNIEGNNFGLRHDITQRIKN